jgi:hypothetical protein
MALHFLAILQLQLITGWPRLQITTIRESEINFSAGTEYNSHFMEGYVRSGYSQKETILSDRQAYTFSIPAKMPCIHLLIWILTVASVRSPKTIYLQYLTRVLDSGYY